jgi:hypothetical protein
MTLTGLPYYINDANTRFTNLLFEGEGKTMRFAGLANINIRTGLPYVRQSNGDYFDALFNDKYYLTSFFIESGDRKDVPAGFTAQVDLVVCANMKKFVAVPAQNIPAYQEEDIIDKVWGVMKLTSFMRTAIVTDFNALAGFTYTEKIKETIHPYFVFRIKTNLTGILKIN